MRIAHICPHFPPETGGLADYMVKLAREFARQGHQNLVCTGRDDTPRVSEFEIAGFHMPWSPKALWQIVGTLKRWKPEAVILQYVPYMYAPKLYGIHPLIPLWVAQLRKTLSCPVALMAHELHYPVGITPDRLVIGVPQMLQFGGLALAADRVFFSYEFAFEKWSKHLPKRKDLFSWLPVGANIEPATETAYVTTIDSLAPGTRVLFQFGSPHPTRLFEYSFRALEQCLRTYGPKSTFLALTAITEQELERELKKSGHRVLRPQILPLGYAPSVEISAWLKRADLVLAPFLDGVNTRRGSVMAALAHARAVVTTRGYHTDPSGHWDEFCAVTPEGNTHAFASKVLELLKTPAEASRLARAGREKYEKSFSWPVIVSEMVKRIQS